MEMTGERRIPAPRQVVWEALNNPDILKASIPGCQSLEKLTDDQMKAVAAVKVGPISARFTGTVHLTDINPPNGYRIAGEGQGGVAGFAKGGANVGLVDDGDDTLLNYQVNAQVGGKLAQLGGRLIDATPKQMADQFFNRFSKEVESLSPAAEAPADAATLEAAAPQPVPAEAAAEGAPAAATLPRGLPGTVAAAQSVASKTAAPEAASPEAALKHGKGTETAAGATMAEPVAAAKAAVSSPAAVSIWSLLPQEPFGLPRVAWVGLGVYALILLLTLGSIY
jgi:carbon monoxide dehydrogenase subunit G